MAQMRAALVTDHFNPPHSIRIVSFRGNTIGTDRRKKAGPATSRLELRVRLKQWISAAHARVSAVLMMVPVFAGERWLSAFLPGDLILIRRQLLAPFFVGLHNLVVRHSLLPELYQTLRRQHRLGVFGGELFGLC